MIKALFSSKPTGSKQFKRVDKCTFGWQPINDLYQRELERVSQNLTRMVPHLREAHCLRDVWTKLNVHPAKDNVSKWIVLFSASGLYEL